MHSTWGSLQDLEKQPDHQEELRFKLPLCVSNTKKYKSILSSSRSVIDCVVSGTRKTFKLGLSSSFPVPDWWLVNHVFFCHISKVCQFLQQGGLKLSLAHPNESRLQAEQCFTFFKERGRCSHQPQNISPVQALPSWGSLMTAHHYKTTTTPSKSLSQAHKHCISSSVRKTQVAISRYLYMNWVELHQHFVTYPAN